MAMVLQPILKTNSSKGDSFTPRVTFNLPSEGGIIQYLEAGDNLSQASKLHSVIKLLSSPDVDDSLVMKWLIELRDNILFLDKEHESITKALLTIPWYTKDVKFIAVYREFILNLVTAHTYQLRLVLSMFVKIFLMDSFNKETEEENNLLALQRIHSILKNILVLVPVAQDIFCSMLNECFPYIKNSPSVFLPYVQNMLRVCSYFPSKRSFILQCIIEKLIHIDVHCSRETIKISEMEAEENDELMEHIDTEAPASEKIDEMAHPFANVLDVLMNFLLEYIRKTCCIESGDQLNWEATKKLYKEMLTIFDKIILSTPGCCHVQYLLFYICSFRQELCDGFLDYLWKKVQNPNVGYVYRQISSFYIGSLLSRAKYISISTVTACFDLMCNWVHRYIDANTSQDIGVHGTFHSVCQTMFYVFAFRIKELTEMPNGYSYLRNLNFDRIVTCRLNPLKYCDKTVVQNFASCARNHQIAYVYPVIEKNNRNLMYTSFESKEEENLTGALTETFFPFDPYLLKQSKKWIEPLYRIYNHTHKEEELDIEDVEDISVNEELFSYSTSPGFKRIHSVFKDINY